MKNKLAVALLCLLLASTLSRAEGPTQHASQPKQSGIDPCSLLRGAEIVAVQGEPVEDAKPSRQPGSGLIMLQCLFRTTTPTKSVSLALAAPSAISPRAFWRKQFHAGEAATKPDNSDKAEKKSVAERHEREEDESTRPRPIAGLGDEAYWVGGPIAGALYVLKGNTFLRISVGGIREESARIEKSKALARIALKRM